MGVAWKEGSVALKIATERPDGLDGVGWKALPMVPSHVLKRAVEALRESVVIVDAQAADRPIIYVNEAFEQVTGYAAAEVVGRNCRFLQGERTDPASVARIREAIETQAGCTVELLNYRKDGSIFHNELRIAPVFDDAGVLTHFIGLQRDVTREALAEEKVRDYAEQLASMNRELHEMATHDPLTELPNRRAFEQRIEELCGAAMRQRTPLSVFMIDVDHFKTYNDNYGHRQGDACLRRVGTFLESVVRRSDVAARYGGEEFIVAMVGNSPEDDARLAERLRAGVADMKLAHAFSDGANHVTISVGYASNVPEDINSINTLIESADRALYRAKDQGRNRVAAAVDDQTVAT